MADVFDGAENVLDLVEELLVERFSNPLGPVADVLGIGAAGNGGGDIGIGAGELEGEFSDVGAA